MASSGDLLKGLGALFLALCWSMVGCEAVNNGLARTPQMGYNTWYSFQCNLHEDLLMKEV